MHDNRAALSRADLEASLSVWLATAGIDQPAIIRDLWTRRDEPRDVEKRQEARGRLAAYLAAKFAVSDFEVTMPANPLRHHPMGR